jgi:hypothetical protein
VPTNLPFSAPKTASANKVMITESLSAVRLLYEQVEAAEG